MEHNFQQNRRPGCDVIPVNKGQSLDTRRISLHGLKLHFGNSCRMNSPCLVNNRPSSKWEMLSFGQKSIAYRWILMKMGLDLRLLFHFPLYAMTSWYPIDPEIVFPVESKPSRRVTGRFVPWPTSGQFSLVEALYFLSFFLLLQDTRYKKLYLESTFKFTTIYTGDNISHELFCQQTWNIKTVQVHKL